MLDDVSSSEAETVKRVARSSPVGQKAAYFFLIISAPQLFNDVPLTVMHESSVSSDRKIEVMRTDSDPRNGTSAGEPSNISRDKPAASLFQAPAGYTVQEHTPGGHRGFRAAP